MSKDQQLKNIVEAVFLVADAPVSLQKMKSLFPEDATPQHQQLLEVIGRLQEEWQERGMELKKIGSGYRFQSRERYAPWLRRLNEGRPPRFSRAQLETLSIIAYRQPVTRGDIEEIRGVSVSPDIIRALLERGWIREVGHRDVPGKPALIATTQEFLAYFNLTSLRELPVLSAKREISEIAEELNLTLPVIPTVEASLESEPSPVIPIESE
ncbi:MAG: SMC-Scp complex subunit ScpB [Acidiferrobacteraceae bacterium]|jgi:segregation and condensation protein B|nr:SMC-Scp complex subunit ScpB [Acidiferrobacteraceae bacterium]MDP6433946.1 SMC-Scp complex subunit ScpB [Arenicellales bacterium]MDP6672678.1 SMC-Scp complex subunit ScpB [Arenicellales bacterium]MDP6725484.1 SMC-Scp complex subunit ScpB [Arenicellales bacterium]|tara:strand:- start:430 stop:1062 length:633 start_codon:yes stop_codon:yes gene_type:complete